MREFENRDDFCSYERNQFHYPTHRLVMFTLYSVAALVTTGLNLLILISIWRTPSLHKPSYILIGSLALSDLLVGAIGEPSAAISYFAAIRHWSPNIFCPLIRFTKGVVYGFGGISLLTLTAISLDRLLAVKMVNRYQNVMTVKNVFRGLLTCWITACIVSPALFGTLSYDYDNLFSLMLLAGIGSFIFVVVMTACYSMAFYSLRKITSSSVAPSVQNDAVVAGPRPNIDVAKYRKSLITMLVVFVLTILFYAPFVGTLILFGFSAGQDKSLSKMYVDTRHKIISVAEFIALLNSAINPMLYLWRIRDIRKAVKTTIKTASSWIMQWMS